MDGSPDVGMPAGGGGYCRPVERGVLLGNL